MAMTVGDCERMQKTEKRTGKLLMITQNQRYNTGYERAREFRGAMAFTGVPDPAHFDPSVIHVRNW